MKVRLENSTEAFADPAIKDLSLIVPISTQSKIEQEEVDNLGKAVESGVGLGGYHGGMGDAFRDAVDYQVHVRRSVGAAPRRPSQDYVTDYTVNVKNHDDPIMKGINDFPYRSEQLLFTWTRRSKCSPQRLSPVNTRRGRRASSCRLYGSTTWQRPGVLFVPRSL